MSDVQVTRNDDASRYEALLDGELAGFLVYETDPDRIRLVHTQVDDAYAGKGVGSALVRGTLDDLRARGGRPVEPVCPFVASWMDAHPDYLDLKA